MFLFAPIPWYSWVAWFVVLGALIGLNEVTRRWKWAGLAFFVALPVILTIFVWPITAGAGSSTGTWFHWVKVYSALAGCLGFMAIRYIPKLAANRWVLIFPAAILAINIAEACIRDFQVGAMNANGMVDGVFMVSGPWNYLNGIAGLINLVTICGWFGIFISKDSSKDMIWPDMLWFWIIAYDLWNFAYVYNCVGDHAFYAGAALLISCTIPAFFIKKGAWLQHRASTLALWMMFTMAVPGFVTASQFSVSASHNPAALVAVSVISLAANVAVLVYQAYTAITRHKNVLTDELYDHLAGYREVAAANRDVPLAAAEPVSVR
jgi:undecaprenyl pyrophosphate phosphatase UppP